MLPKTRGVVRRPMMGCLGIARMLEGVEVALAIACNFECPYDNLPVRVCSIRRLGGCCRLLVCGKVFVIPCRLVAVVLSK